MCGFCGQATLVPRERKVSLQDDASYHWTQSLHGVTELSMACDSF